MVQLTSIYWNISNLSKLNLIHPFVKQLGFWKDEMLLSVNHLCIHKKWCITTNDKQIVIVEYLYQFYATNIH